MRQVTQWVRDIKEIEFARVQLEKYGTVAVLQRQGSLVAYFRADMPAEGTV